MPADRRRVVLTDEGPVLVSGPVDLVLADGRRVTSQRPVVALCGCRRSRRYPFCDTSHRTKVRATTGEEDDRC
ncbi:MAG: CDGSH iron-sulfur domain-containing protein [Pseudonocardiaceae bacterium]|nr:CDGSH iron-sulfur domain-containing protein [Pseudonocardiaceae bacterium]